jgi:methylated-DNA-protein-cysteine methyltransferase-like protein
MQKFTSPPDPQAFRLQVWEIVKTIPFGRVASYGQIAAHILAPPGVNLKDFQSFAPRWVGGAMAACPSDVPWHRVINSQGKISLSGQNAQVQRQLLESEGVLFDERERIDLKVYGWSASQPSQGKLDL